MPTNQLVHKAFTLTFIVSVLSAAAVAQSQAPAATPAPAKTKSATTTSKPATASTYDRALLKPTLLKDQAPATYQVKFDTTRGAFHNHGYPGVGSAWRRSLLQPCETSLF